MLRRRLQRREELSEEGSFLCGENKEEERKSKFMKEEMERRTAEAAGGAAAQPERKTDVDGLKPFEKKIWLSSPTMHGPELKYMREAYDTNWMSTVGENINEVERLTCEKTGCGYAVALASGTAALHMAVKMAGVKPGEKVFCSDMTFDATVNPVKYEGGEPVFIDTEYDTWNMDPAALEKAFELYPEVRTVVLAHLYGTPAKMDEIREICRRHGAVIIEDAAESLGATYRGSQTGTFGTYNCVSFNGNKIITGSSGGMLLTDDREAADKVRKWSTQARENAPWYQHEELGYNYRMSNVIAGVVRGQYSYLEEHIAQKKAIYERYKKGLEGLPVDMNPYDVENSEPNFWLSCLLIRPEAMCLRSGVRQRAGKELSDGNPGDAGEVQRRGKTSVETDAHAADLPDERIRDERGQRKSQDKRLHQRRSPGSRRKTTGCGNGSLSQRIVPAER